MLGQVSSRSKTAELEGFDGVLAVALRAHLPHIKSRLRSETIARVLLSMGDAITVGNRSSALVTHCERIQSLEKGGGIWHLPQCPRALRVPRQGHREPRIDEIPTDERTRSPACWDFALEPVGVVTAGLHDRK